MEVFNKKVELIKIYLSVGMCIFGCAMLVAGFIVIPTGIIHNSVLVAFGEILTFAGAILGINYLYSSKHKELESKMVEQVNKSIENSLKNEN